MGTSANKVELQIWRQTGPDTYTKIGFSSVTANATASPNVHEYYPETTLQFQQGDVLGVYYPDETNIEIYGQRGSGPSNYYTNNDTASNLKISDLTISGNDFPLVSIGISKSNTIMARGTTIISSRSQDTKITVSPYFEIILILCFIIKVPLLLHVNTETATARVTQPSQDAPTSVAMQSSHGTTIMQPSIQPPPNASSGILAAVTIPSVTVGVVAICLLILIPTIVLLKLKCTSCNIRLGKNFHQPAYHNPIALLGTELSIEVHDNIAYKDHDYGRRNNYIDMPTRQAISDNMTVDTYENVSY